MAKAKNERLTENIVRDTLQKLGYKDNPDITIDEQKSENPTIQKLLQTASKSGKGVGKPEFIIRHTQYPDFIIVIECKPDTKFHQSKTLDKYKDYAVDGVLNYASHLSKSFNIIAIAISGQQAKDIKISSFIWVRNAPKFDEFVSPDNTAISEFLTFDKYVTYALYDHKIEKEKFADLISFSKELHNYMRDYAKLSETEKPLLVSGILIALFDNAFALSYQHFNQKTELAKKLQNAIEDVIETAEIPKAKKKNMIQPYSFIMVHPELSKINSTTKETPLYRLIKDIDDHVKPFINVYHNFDVIGQFYGEFLRYTGGDKKGLGIVLTPKHVTELFAKLANLTQKSIVLDTCAGTSGFLIASMYEMMKKAKTDDEKLYIKKNCLIGVEQQPNMYALASSNMILRGDGKANLYQGSCFDEAITKEISDRADVGMINPPYSQKGEGLHELDFVNHLLNCLKPNSIGIAVVPMSCAISPHTMREKILSNHRLDAVMSLPDDIFYPIGVVTCIMVFTAHVPHEQNKYYKTWFGYWKNDGYIKTKLNGRIDGGNWRSIEKNWLDGYFNRNEVAGLSVLKKVTAQDEWCAEAYMETDYSDLTEQNFINEMKKFVLFKTLN